MRVKVIEDANVLIPNDEHKNFVENGDVIEKNTELVGNKKRITGLRRGKPFTYKLFITKNNQILYLKSIKPMETTEVTLGYDGEQSTTVNFKPAELFSKMKIGGLVIGAISGFAYAKYKKQDMKKVVLYIGIGASIGYLSAILFDKKNKVLITSKN